MEGFKSIESAERYARLLVGCYRFKRFTDSHNGNNGKAPLELAGVTLMVGIGFRSYWIARSADAGTARVLRPRDSPLRPASLAGNDYRYGSCSVDIASNCETGGFDWSVPSKRVHT